MEKLKYILLAFICMGWGGCKDDPEVKAADLIKTIQAAVRQDNALRVDITLQLQKAAVSQITYWKEGDESTKKQTALAEPEMSVTTTLVFLEPKTTYCFKVAVASGSETAESDEYKFTTGELPLEVPTCSILADNMEEAVPGYILLMQQEQTGYIEVVNTEGTVVWYEKMGEKVTVATFDPEFNTFSCLTGKHPQKEYTAKNLVVIDIYGNRLLEKDVESMYAHHDVRRLPDGNLIVVHYVAKPYDLSVYGGSTQEMVWGDGYSVLDMKGNVLEEWDCFGEMNPQDDPHIMEVVPSTTVLDNPIKYREDWLHANSINYDSEGNIYMSFNWRSELWKINRKTGKVHYRVGADGTVELPADGEASGLHTCVPLAPDRVLVYDNGLSNHRSRALVYKVDEAAGKATVEMNVALDVAYTSPYMSSVYRVNDNLLLFGSTFGQCVVFTDKEGNVLRTLSTPYQSFRADYIPALNY